MAYLDDLYRDPATGRLTGRRPTAGPEERAQAGGWIRKITTFGDEFVPITETETTETTTDKPEGTDGNPGSRQSSPKDASSARVGEASAMPARRPGTEDTSSGQGLSPAGSSTPNSEHPTSADQPDREHGRS